MLFNEPKLLKFFISANARNPECTDVSVLFNEPKLLKSRSATTTSHSIFVSVLFNEPKLLKSSCGAGCGCSARVSVLFNEPKLLKCTGDAAGRGSAACFSALQRAEIAEIHTVILLLCEIGRFSALQRAEIAEIEMGEELELRINGFSALQRAEIAEISSNQHHTVAPALRVSVLFNEPKLLKWDGGIVVFFVKREFQCSSTSRNC